MHFVWIIAIACLFFTIASAQYTITVGKDGSPAFDPPFLDGISSGDSLVFRIYRADPPHDVSESTFEQPCVHKPGGLRFLSIPPPDVPFSDITLMPRVTPGEPRWFNVLPTDRCAAGMVFAINPTAQQTYEAFKARAMGGAIPSSTRVPIATTKATSSSTSASSAPRASVSTSATAKAVSNPIHKMTAALAGVFLIQLFV